MEIPGTTRRPLADGCAIDTKAPSIPSAPSVPTDSARLGAPTTTQQWSTHALLLSLIKLLETMPADQASALLLGLATKLSAAAERPDAVAPRLQAWVERFQAAAQSGDLSKLLPNVEPAAHFGIRAYQAAGQATAEDIELVALLRETVALPGALAVQGSETSKAGLVPHALVAEAVDRAPGNPHAPSGPSVFSEALALSWARRGDAAVHLRRRRALAVRRFRRRRRRRPLLGR